MAYPSNFRASQNGRNDFLPFFFSRFFLHLRFTLPLCLLASQHRRRVAASFRYLPSQQSGLHGSQYWRHNSYLSLLPFPAMLSPWQVLCCLHKAMRGLEVTRLEQESSFPMKFYFLLGGKPRFMALTSRSLAKRSRAIESNRIETFRKKDDDETITISSIYPNSSEYFFRLSVKKANSYRSLLLFSTGSHPNLRERDAKRKVFFKSNERRPGDEVSSFRASLNYFVD